MVDIAAATDFLTANARLLDRQRLLLSLGACSPEQVLSAVDAYRNTDGSYGWGLEPDLRDPSGQPGAALHAFEVFAEVAEASGLRTPSAMRLCYWLSDVALPDGGLPFALPVTSAASCAPFWAGADHEHSSLHITTVVTATALRLARHDDAVAGHPWLVASVRYCLDTIASRAQSEHTLELLYSLMFLDALSLYDPSQREVCSEHARRLGAVIPPSGLLHVEGGIEDEYMRPLSFAPLPGAPSRELFSPEVIDSELDHLEGRQQADGGWPEEFASYSPQAALEWRGYLTVAALNVLNANGRGA